MGNTSGECVKIVANFGNIIFLLTARPISFWAAFCHGYSWDKLETQHMIVLFLSKCVLLRLMGYFLRFYMLSHVLSEVSDYCMCCRYNMVVIHHSSAGYLECAYFAANFSLKHNTYSNLSMVMCTPQIGYLSTKYHTHIQCLVHNVMWQNCG